MPKVAPHLVALLERDVNSTVGDGFGSVIAEFTENVAALDVQDGDVKLVEDVQQYLMDTYVDTCWPACPRHRSHPLWYRAGAWWCEMDEVEVCRLGSSAGLQVWSENAEDAAIGATRPRLPPPCRGWTTAAWW